MTNVNEKKLGFIGMGRMGIRMAGRLRDARLFGHCLGSYDQCRPILQVLGKHLSHGIEWRVEQIYTAAMAKGEDEDFSVVIRLMLQLAGVSL